MLWRLCHKLMSLGEDVEVTRVSPIMGLVSWTGFQQGEARGAIPIGNFKAFLRIKHEKYLYSRSPGQHCLKVTSECILS